MYGTALVEFIRVGRAAQLSCHHPFCFFRVERQANVGQRVGQHVYHSLESRPVRVNHCAIVGKEQLGQKVRVVAVGLGDGDHSAPGLDAR